MLAVDILIQGLIQGSMHWCTRTNTCLWVAPNSACCPCIPVHAWWISWRISNEFTGSIFLALLAMIVVGFVGMASYGFISPIIKPPPLIALIASIGIFIASEGVPACLCTFIFLMFQHHCKSDRTTRHIDKWYIMVVVLAFALLLGVNWLSRRTRLGIATRAGVVDPGMAIAVAN